MHNFPIDDYHCCLWGFTCQNHHVIMKHAVVEEDSENFDHLGVRNSLLPLLDGRISAGDACCARPNKEMLFVCAKGTDVQTIKVTNKAASFCAWTTKKPAAALMRPSWRFRKRVNLLVG